MHVLVFIDLDDKADKDFIYGAIEGVLSNFVNTMAPMRNLFIIRLKWESERDAITRELTTLAKTLQGQIAFLVTPVIKTGGYEGWITEDKWGPLNEITRTMGFLEALGRTAKPIHVSDAVRKSLQGSSGKGGGRNE